MGCIVQKSYALKLAALDSEGQRGHFDGIALPFNEPDSHGDVIRPTAFAKSIQSANGRFPLLWVHNQCDVLGTINVEADQRALKAHGELLIDAVPKAAEVYELLKAQAIKGLSVGFVALRSEELPSGGRAYSEGRLLEISLCACPAYSGAQVSDVRSLETLAKTLHDRGDHTALKSLRSTIDAMLHDDERGEAALLSALRSFDANRWRG